MKSRSKQIYTKHQKCESPLTQAHFLDIFVGDFHSRRKVRAGDIPFMPILIFPGMILAAAPTPQQKKTSSSLRLELSKTTLIQSLHRQEAEHIRVFKCELINCMARKEMKDHLHREADKTNLDSLPCSDNIFPLDWNTLGRPDYWEGRTDKTLITATHSQL